MLKDLDKKLTKILVDLNLVTREKEMFEAEYELKRSKLLFSADVSAFSNQTARDAQINIICEQDGSYLKMAELRYKSKNAYCTWQTYLELFKKSNNFNTKGSNE